ncbi:class I SAM-dependent methyltransferase [Snuella sedimenti]|uniref:Class I SAM-dependent methyltransferase n=1 Tax=Snuella sedimenti TaxID=2798802 RepID=A0A8J7IFX4_9FLAO|nr:class I SAM-dependent methyltransferase [Snuella sedimenti]MBJ6368462.1 class I SAM-dependent methyltransferase [Snuella sedimenti]
MVKGKTYLRVKDYSVSGEEFDLVLNSEFDFLETFPKPSESKLPEYYKSEDYISHTDTKRNTFEKAYHFVRKMALKRKLSLINSFGLKGKKLLDVGCGTGDFLKVAKDDKWEVFGVEPNEQARTMANQKTGNAVFETDRLLKFPEASFDVISLWHVLEHLPNLHEQIILFKKLLKPDGVLIIAVPNYKSYDAYYYKKYWAAYDVPRHLWHFSRTSVSKLFEKQDMVVKKIKPMWFDAFYVSMLSEKYKTRKMNPIMGFWVGCLSNCKALITKECSSLIYIIKNTEK